MRPFSRAKTKRSISKRDGVGSIPKIYMYVKVSVSYCFCMMNLVQCNMLK